MEKYRDQDGHLNLVARQEIQRLLEKGIRIKKISEIIGFSNVSIYTEVNKNTIDGPYNAELAQKNAEYSYKRGQGNLHRLKTSRKLNLPPPHTLQQDEHKEARLKKIEEEVESLKTIIQTLSTLIEELYDTINNKLRHV